jgi:peroxiredoxin
MTANKAQTLLFSLLLMIFTITRSIASGDSPATLHAVADRPMAPEFALADIDGVIHRLSDYRGQVVIVNFWATWCPPCREEMPSMQRAWEQIQDEAMVILAIDVGEDADTIFTFTADYPVEFPLLLDLDSRVIQEWPVRGLPTTFIVDPQGRIAYRAIGTRDWEDPALLETLRALHDGQGEMPRAPSNGPSD